MASDISHMLKAIPCPGKVEKLPTAKRELSSTTCGPPRRPRRVGHGACEIGALARSVRWRDCETDQHLDKLQQRRDGRGWLSR
jgi:hypothetical protein